MSSKREKTRPGERASASSSLNSDGVSSTGSPPPTAWGGSGARDRGPPAELGPGVGAGGGAAPPAVEAQHRLGDRAALAGTAQERADAGDELARAERLDEVVVGAEVEPADAVVLGGLRREHHDRDVRVAAQV